MHDTHGLPVNFVCKDGTSLGAHLWPSATGTDCGTVIINAATGVPARYYHRYARFLSEHGFTVLTYDYRGIGLSRPASLRGYACRWADWGEKDFSAAIDFIRQRQPGGPLVVVGHSIGGFLPGLAANAPAIDRMLTVGAQYGYCADYAAVHRWRLFLKWHVAMPVLTAALGYFPGKRLGWLEDLPAGVAKDWSFRRARMELSHPRSSRPEIVNRLASVTADTLAICVSDDAIGTPAAIRRALHYYRNANTTGVRLTPEDCGCAQIGHFGLFHDRHAAGFWLDTLLWLREGINPWPGRPLTATETTTERAIDLHYVSGRGMI